MRRPNSRVRNADQRAAPDHPLVVRLLFWVSGTVECGAVAAVLIVIGLAVTRKFG